MNLKTMLVQFAFLAVLIFKKGIAMGLLIQFSFIWTHIFFVLFTVAQVEAGYIIWYYFLSTPEVTCTVPTLPGNRCL